MRRHRLDQRNGSYNPHIRFEGTFAQTDVAQIDLHQSDRLGNLQRNHRT